MTLPTSPASALDQVFTRYAFHKIGGKEYKDQKYKRRAILQLLNERSIDGGGGVNIVHPINLGTSANGGSLSRNQEFSIEGDANETWSRYTWKTVYETCFVSWWDIREAKGGPHKMIRILDSRINETRENMEDNIETMLCTSGSRSASTDIGPILKIVKSTGATGQLNPSTSGQSVWASEVEDTIAWSEEGIGRSRELYNKLEDNKANPDVFILPDQFFNETCELGDAALVLNQDIKTRGGTKYADLGTKVPLIMNTPVIRSPAWNSSNTGTGVCLDLDGIHMVVDPQWDMYMWPFKEMVYHGKLGQASVQVKVCELTCSSRRTQGLLSTVS